MLSVINKIHWWVTRRRLLIAGDGRRVSAVTCTPPSKCWRHATVQQWSMPKSDIGRISRFLPHGDLRQNIAITFGMEKLEWCGYPIMKKNEDMFIHFNRIHERDRQTVRRKRHMTAYRPRLCIASRAQNGEKSRLRPISRYALYLGNEKER